MPKAKLSSIHRIRRVGAPVPLDRQTGLNQSSAIARQAGTARWCRRLLVSRGRLDEAEQLHHGLIPGEPADGRGDAPFGAGRRRKLREKQGMKCFRHSAVDAVGTCKVCCKGLCPECAADLGHSLACKGACETAADQVAAIIQYNSATVGTQRRHRYLSPVFLLVVGLVFLGFGHEHWPEFNLLTVMGTGILGFSLYQFYAISRWSREAEQKQ